MNDLKTGSVVIFLTNAYRDSNVPEGSVGIVLNEKLDVQVSTEYGIEKFKSLRPDEIRLATTDDLYDGEVIGLDGKDVVQWDASKREAYNCGQTIGEFGRANLTPSEKGRVLTTTRWRVRKNGEELYLQGNRSWGDWKTARKFVKQADAVAYAESAGAAGFGLFSRKAE